MSDADSSHESRQIIYPPPEDGGVWDWTGWIFNNLAWAIILGITYAVIWVVDKGPFFPPFGGETNE